MQQSYRVGEYVIYGKSGLCRIEAIEPLSFTRGESKLYFVLKPMSGTAGTIYVPCDNVILTSKLRSVLSKQEIDNALFEIKGKQLDWIDDKNTRADYFRALFNGGKQEDLLLLVGCLYLKKKELTAKGRHLANADETILKNSEKLLEEEFAFSLQISPDEVGEYIRKALELEDL